jgi:hypothetical protein
MAPDYRMNKNIVIKLKENDYLRIIEIDSVGCYFPDRYWNLDDSGKKHIIDDIYNKQYFKVIYDLSSKWKSNYYKYKFLPKIIEEVSSIEDVNEIRLTNEILYLYE